MLFPGAYFKLVFLNYFKSFILSLRLVLKLIIYFSMVRSMTGYGKAEVELQHSKLTMEIKSLNSKQLDLNARIPYAFNEKELQLRSLISKRLERGKISVFINMESLGTASKQIVNTELAKHYYHQIKGLARELGNEHTQEILPAVLNIPDVIKGSVEEMDKEDMQKFLDMAMEAIKKIDAFRIHEGAVLEKDFRFRITNIMELLQQLDQFENVRVEKIKERIAQALSDHIDESKIDKNRLEQELIFYIEKLDVTEEKIRLNKHCQYFIETLDDTTKSKGKKLGFVLQEIGREINTLGSKSNDSDMQRIVVQMKDELEKIKEQMLNIL